MKSGRLRVILPGLVAAALWLAGCATEQARAVAAGRAEISQRIASIREAILARQAEGIVRYGTEDWSFTGPDGVTFNRASYLARTQTLFARVPVIESLETKIDRLAVTPPTADVEITQTMVRREIDPATKAESRVWLRYREQHTWRQTERGWCVQRVAFLGAPERRVLPVEP